MFPYNPNNRRLAEVALGNEPADLVIRDATLMDVYTGRLVPHRSVACAGKWIAYIGPDADYTIGAMTRVIEGDGRVIAPGYIDPHTHIANFCDISEILRYTIPGGTTTYVTEVESYPFAMGGRGFAAFLERVRTCPVKIFCLVPPMVTASPASANLTIKVREAKRFLAQKMVIGLGESYWQNAILGADKRIYALIQETAKVGKVVEGHAAGAVDRRLAAYAAAGAWSCHEAISPEDVLARLEMGYCVMLREGYIRQDLDALRPLIGKIDLGRCCICTDGCSPEQLLARGYLVDVLQKGVDIGIPPLEVIRMATINAATHLRLDHLLGGIAPGRLADIVVLPRPDVMRPDAVISEGLLVAEGGKTIVPLPKGLYPHWLKKGLRVRKVSPDAFAVPVNSCSRPGGVRTMDIQTNGLVAREGFAEVYPHGDQILADPKRDLLKVAFIERATGREERFVGFVRGWGMRAGGIATTQVWDASGITAVGASDEEIAFAINRVIEVGGGTALVRGRQVLVEIPAPIAGYISEDGIEEVAAKLNRLHEEVDQLGCRLPAPLLTLVTTTTAAIPFIRVTERGYFRFREQDYVGV